MKELYNISKDILHDLYINQKLSADKVGKKLGCSAGTIYNRLKEYEIPRRRVSAGLSLESHHNWKGGLYKDEGYVKIKARDHPNANKGGYVPEHRIVMEGRLGRYLRKEEIVHHLNGIRNDNRIGNLFLCENRTEHYKIHQHLQKIAIEIFSSNKPFCIRFDKIKGEYYKE